ncbi:hypothetical protein GCM10010521_07940 [Streptomyces rameus]|uniref:Holin n=1 Tax=Streptomyces rameus TaxID=68261 RepID=A0ABP6MRC0_9ACTN
MTQPTDDVGQSKDSAAERSLQATRAWTGLTVILLGDLAITLAAIWGVNSTGNAQTVAILASAFTAVSTMTTAYFGIRGITNTAQSSIDAAPSSQP